MPCEKCEKNTLHHVIFKCIECSNKDEIMKLLCDIKTLLLDVDTPTREQRSDIVHRIAAIE